MLAVWLKIVDVISGLLISLNKSPFHLLLFCKDTHLHRD